MDETERRAEIARLNDEFRIAGCGMIVLTAGIAALPIQTRDLILAAVRDHHHDGDGEHRAGTLMAGGHEVIWYILYHRCDCDPGREADPADRTSTERVLVIMLTGEP